MSLSFTKFKIRRIRTILTLITTSILSLVLVVASCTLTGIIGAANATPQSALADLHLANVSTNSTAGELSTTPFVPRPSKSTAPSDPQKEIAGVRDRVKNPAALRDIYVEMSSPNSDNANLDIIDGPKKPQPGDANFDPNSFAGAYNNSGIASRSSELLKPFVDPSQNLDWKRGDPLPVLVPTKAVLDAHEKEFSTIKKAKLRVAKREEYKKALLGKVGKFEVSESSFTFLKDSNVGAPAAPTPAPKSKSFSVRVVGFLPTANGLAGGESYRDYLFPYESTSKDADVAGLLNEPDQLFPSFTTTKSRNDFVSKNDDASIYADTIESNKEYFNPLKHVFSIAVIVMLVLMAIPMAATMSKLLVDSQRETGVFRAIGARNRNVVSIYGFYALQMVVASFVLALILGELICAWLTSRYADDLELAAADYASTVVNVSFVQFNVVQMATIFGGLLAGALLGVTIPLLRALRRDPIKALRDE